MEIGGWVGACDNTHIAKNRITFLNQMFIAADFESELDDDFWNGFTNIMTDIEEVLEKVVKCLDQIDPKREVKTL